jgi:hypothetical protein
LFFFLSYKWFVPFTYSVEKLGSGSDALNANIDNLYDKIEWLKQNEENSKIILKIDVVRFLTS